MPAVTATTLYQQCDHVLTRHPAAVYGAGQDVFAVLTVTRPRDAFYVLARYASGQFQPTITLRPWGSDSGAVMTPDGFYTHDGLTEAHARQIVDTAVLLPRDASLFAWIHPRSRVATALVRFTAHRELDISDLRASGTMPVPGITVMPLAGTAPAMWPPFPGGRGGAWFWDHYHDGFLVEIGGIIAAHPRTVYWVDTTPVTGWPSIAVTADLRLGNGCMLHKGMYVAEESLQHGAAVPAVEDAAGFPGSIDLSARFRKP
jgi:hypothetical protein